VLYAFLSVQHFRHMARGLAVLEMSNKNVAGIIDRGSLPRRDQLDIHVDYEEFTQLLEEYWRNPK